MTTSTKTTLQRQWMIFAAAILSVVMGGGQIAFYASFGNGIVQSLYYGTIGLCLFGGFIIAVSYWIRRLEWSVPGAARSAGMLLGVLILFILNIIGSVGVMSLIQKDKELSGLGAQAARAEIQSLELQAGQLQGAAGVDVSAVTAQIAAKQAEMSTLLSVIADCRKKHIDTNCVKPKTAEANTLRGEIEALQASISGAERLAGLSEKMAQAKLSYAQAVQSGGTGDIAPVYLTLSKLLGGRLSPHEARDLQVLISAAVVEIFLAFFWAGLLDQGKREEVSVQEDAVPSYRYGGPVKHHGIAEVHGTEEEPEYVLTPEMVKAVGGLDPLETLRQRIHGFQKETPSFQPETPPETRGFQSATTPPETQPETPPGSGGNVRGEDAEKKCVKEAALKWVKALKSAKPRGQKNTPVKVTIRQARAELGCRTSDISDVIFPELMEAGLLTVEYSQSGKITGYYY